VPVALVQRITPPGFIIGASVGSPAEAAEAGEADYWGIGPWRSTTTKGDAGAALGPDGFRQLVGMAGGRPCLAIGGLRPQDVATVLAAGGSGVAVVSGILREEDIEAGTRSYAAGLAAS
jgi:thiamine-phosphate pyrophosphorylase